MPEPACAQPETCWEGGLFHFAIEFPQGYPFKPFKLWLETKMYHPNVSVQGEGEGGQPLVATCGKPVLGSEWPSGARCNPVAGQCQ